MINVTTNKIKVLTTTVPPEGKGGIAALHQVLFDRTLDKNFEPIPFYFSSPRPFSEPLLRRLFRIFWGMNCFSGVLIRNKAIKIVHINTAPDMKALLRDTLLILLAVLLKRKVILQIHGAIAVYDYPRVANWIIKPVLSSCDMILVYSMQDIKKIKSFVGEERVKIFPNAIKVDDFKNGDKSFKSRLSIPEENKVVLFLSRMIREKGPFEILDSVPEVVKKFGKVNFVFAGDGPEIINLKQTCKEKNLEKWVRITGHLNYDNVLKAFGIANIFALPTYYIEGLPMAVLQALASGLPVISTRYGAIPDIIEDGEHGFLIEPNSPEELSEKLLYLLTRDDIAARIRETNINYARREFDGTVVLNKLGKLYSKILAGD